MAVVKAAGAAGGATFIRSRDRFETVLAWWEGDKAATLSHAELEEQLQGDAACCSVSCFRTIRTCAHTQRTSDRARNDDRGVPRYSAETWAYSHAHNGLRAGRRGADRPPPTR
jgi:hypothetical protein